jgi:hypothetical protein
LLEIVTSKDISGVVGEKAFSVDAPGVASVAEMQALRKPIVITVNKISCMRFRIPNYSLPKRHFRLMAWI